MLHWCVYGMPRSSAAIVIEWRTVWGPGTKTKPSVGSETFRMPGVVEIVRASEFGGLVRRLAPFCENTDWKMRPWYSP